MSNEIEIGEYVRTNSGYIFQVVEIQPAMSDETDSCSASVKGENYNFAFVTDIVKHSKNIIDLIEEGDYVNESIVTDYYFVGNQKVLVLNNEKITYEENENFVPQLAIKTIVTKEQFASMEYKVGV